VSSFDCPRAGRRSNARGWKRRGCAARRSPCRRLARHARLASSGPSRWPRRSLMRSGDDRMGALLPLGLLHERWSAGYHISDYLDRVGARTSRWLLREGKHGRSAQRQGGFGFGSRLKWPGLGQRQGDGGGLRPRGSKGPRC
jgi:hypothetical protein